MGLFTNPVVLDTRSFSFRAQRTDDKKSVVGDYIEDAADIAASSLLTVKHDSSGSVNRHLLSRTISLVPAADPTGPRRRMTINFTIVADPLFSAAEVDSERKVIVAAVGQSNFVANMLTSRI